MDTKTTLEVIRCADADDLAILVDIITDSGKGRISLAQSTCDLLHKARTDAPETLHHFAENITQEVELFGGNSIANVWRGGKGVPYPEVLRDVADQQKVNYNKETADEEIEIQVLLKILEKSMEKMTPAERDELMRELSGGTLNMYAPATMVALIGMVKLGGFASYRIALVVANTLARQITGKGLKLAVNASIARLIGGFAGPIGWALSGLWAAYDIASPAYRVTVPAVVMIAYMRQKQLSASMKVCGECHEPIVGQAKFCGECGAKVDE